MYVCVSLQIYLCTLCNAQHHRHRITLKNVELHKLHKWKIIIHYHELENWTNKQGISTKKQYINIFRKIGIDQCLFLSKYEQVGLDDQLSTDKQYTCENILRWPIYETIYLDIYMIYKYL